MGDAAIDRAGIPLKVGDVVRHLRGRYSGRDCGTILDIQDRSPCYERFWLLVDVGGNRRFWVASAVQRESTQ